MVRVADTFSAPGEHAAIFGERGVGKTSLATITEQIAIVLGKFAVRVNCQANDRAESIWRRVGEGIDRKIRVDRARGVVHEDLEGVVQGAVAILTAPSPTAHDVLVAFDIIGAATELVIFLDEFDRVADPDVETDLVDLMKTISDQAMPITFVIIGVADDVNSLIEEHESIGRGLNEIEMPRMSTDELEDILRRGLGPAEMTATPEASQFVGQLSAGLPHYVHLMGLNAGLAAIGDSSLSVTLDHVLATLEQSVERAQQHVSRLYYTATHSTRPNRFREILLAAALTPTDELGFFAPGDMRAPLGDILGRPTSIRQYSDQLIQFLEDRGPVLTKTGVTNRPRYRMAEPLLVPYVAMRGVSDGLITPETLRRLLSNRQA